MNLLTHSEVLDRRQPAPKQICGIYFLIYKGEIIYVGQSKDINARLLAHAADKQFDEYSIVPCEPENLSELEAAYIVQFSPPYNVTLPLNRTWVTLHSLRNLCKAHGYGAHALRRHMLLNGIKETNGFYRLSDFHAILGGKEDHELPST